MAQNPGEAHRGILGHCGTIWGITPQKCGTIPQTVSQGKKPYFN